ncbi:hypothetical protein [Gaoshiqia sp. Z1-71]|uniref:hypothetical protein n=1 Tax=Gaoshiqia hydrogeniformans TaxID=3290090 RepID=UPI003BF8D401
MKPETFHAYLVTALFATIFLFYSSCRHQPGKTILLNEDFSQQVPGPLLTDLGAHTEYHYLPEARPRSNWVVSTFRYNLPASWEIRKNGHGQNMMVQTATNHNSHWHPMVITGSPFWTNYTLEATFRPGNLRNRNGIVFRYQNDRCYYFLGMDNNAICLMKVNHATGFRQPDETMLAKAYNHLISDDTIQVKVSVSGPEIKVFFPDDQVWEIRDETFGAGKIGLLSDSFTEFYSVNVSAGKNDYRMMQKNELAFKQEQDSLIAQNPKMSVYKKIYLAEYGVGRNIRFGDLNGDGEIDILLGQVVHHGPKDRNSELSCLTAMTLDGQILWRKGTPDPWKTSLTNDVAFQIHDINQDGKNEVIYTMNQELIIAEGATGEIIKKIPTPLTPGGKPLESGHNSFPRILGDCIYFLDLQGKGYNSDFILKDRYQYFWAFDTQLNLLWKNECRTGHYPYAYDTDGDGKDELLMGYSLFDDNGTKLWSLDDELSDHADGVAIVRFDEDEEPKILCAASDEGLFFAGLDGQITRHHYIGHVQNPAVANFRDDLPGLETVSVNFWGNQGIIHLFDKNGNIYHDFEPNQYGSMCLPLNWTGKTEEFFVLNANAEEGGAWDGYGRKVLEFPDDGHPDLCYAVLDITGDCRDEIVVWDTNQLWIYTQDDNPQYHRKFYNPKRTPLYNYSNYQASISSMINE